MERKQQKELEKQRQKEEQAQRTSEQQKEPLREKRTEVIICQKCGRGNETDSRFCVYCGDLLATNPAEKKSDHTDQELEEFQKKIDAETKVCEKCGEKNTIDAGFCVHCGNPLSEASTAQGS